MQEQLIHDWFYSTARRCPERVAIESGPLRVTYQELVERADQLAGMLNNLGVSKGSIVAILADDPVKIIPTILAILKNAAVLVLFDPKLPESGLRAISGLVKPVCLAAE